MKPSQSQLFVIHSLEFYVFGSVFGAVATIYSAFQTGKLDLVSLGVILGTVVSGLIANVYKGVLQNATTLQAVSDTFSELKQSHNATAQQTGNALSQLTGLVTGLFHLHSATQTVVTPPMAPSTPAQSAAQLGGSFGSTASTVPQVPFPVITFGAMPVAQPPAQA